MYQPTVARGFTLLELLIVCLLISISLAMSVPSLRNSLVTDSLASGSRKVVSLVTSARSAAVTSQEAHIIFFDSAEQRIWYKKVSADTEEGEGDVHKIRRSSITLPEGVRVDEVKQATGSTDYNPLKDGLWISERGYMDRTIIRLVDTKQRSINLLISPFLLTIRIVEDSVAFN